MNDQRGVAVALASLGDLDVETGSAATAREHLAQALSLAHHSGDVRLVLEILVAVASLWIKEYTNEQAAQLIVYARQHPALTQEARERIENFSSVLPDSRIQETQLERVVEGVLK